MTPLLGVGDHRHVLELEGCPQDSHPEGIIGSIVFWVEDDKQAGSNGDIVANLEAVQPFKVIGGSYRSGSSKGVPACSGRLPKHQTEQVAFFAQIW